MFALINKMFQQFFFKRFVCHNMHNFDAPQTHKLSKSNLPDQLWIYVSESEYAFNLHNRFIQE